MSNATVTGWTCNDMDGNTATGACASPSSFRGRGNFENILLKITMDAAGDAVFVEGFLVQGGAGAVNPVTLPNWTAWTFSVQAVPLPPAAWLLGSALGVLGWMKLKANS
jgi:hypothetical protein